MSVIEIKEAVGKLSPAELAEVSAFIESREVDCLEQCGRTADERLKSFDQGKINIKNKAGIDKAISAALSPLAGAPESIVITGGASFEGGLDTNKKLVVERAKAVQVYMEGLYPALKGKITVAETDFSKIQTKDVPAEYEQYRKVYLKIKGVLQGDSYTINKEITYTVDAPINADTVEIIQYAITREYSNPIFKTPKKKR